MRVSQFWLLVVAHARINVEREVYSVVAQRHQLLSLVVLLLVSRSTLSST